jgi:DNA-binding transcriptional MerR regulator
MAGEGGRKVSNGGEGLRLTELARTAGLSVQQIRNYVALGFLPPVERAPNGYRVFTTCHADALAVARTLIAGYGWQTALTVMRSVHSGDPIPALAVVDRSHAELDRERTQVKATLEAFDGELPERYRVRRPMNIGDAAAAVGARPSALRVWERQGLLSPGRDRATGYRSYDQAQLTRARVIAMLRRSRYSLRAIREVMDAMIAGDPARTRAALASREQELDRASLRRVRATAALYGYLERSGLVTGKDTLVGREVERGEDAQL